jgi:uncharacterized YigZ family protein
VEEDAYHTIAAPAEASVRERASRFLALAWPVESEERVRELLEPLRKKYYDATHHCYAWRIGDQERANDDGEPAGTAGRPILGQILSRGLTNVLVVVVRWFGGTKLGVPGLIAAYREAARDVLAAAEVVEKTVDVRLTVRFDWAAMNDVMKTIKEMQPKVGAQVFDNVCVIELTIRRGLADQLVARLEKCSVIEIKYE